MKLILWLIALLPPALADVRCAYFDAVMGKRIARFCRIDGVLHELPASVVKLLNIHELESGTTQLFLKGLHTVGSEWVGKAKSAEILWTPTARSAEHPFARPTSGDHKILVVRILSSDGLEPSMSSEELSDVIFSENKVTVASQYRRCSMGALKFGPIFGSGVVDLQIDQNMNGSKWNAEVDRAIFRAFTDTYGPQEQFDFIMYCFPQGFGPGDAFAPVHHYASYYYDPQCSYLSTAVHELGHSLGMRHSGLEWGGKNLEYYDYTCSMGFTSQEVGYPQKCFNAAKLWGFNWWPEQKAEVVDELSTNGTWTGMIASFVDVANTDMDVVLRVGDLYVVYNRAKGHNLDVSNKNQVSVVRASGSAFNDSYWVGYMTEGMMRRLTTTATFPGEGVVPVHIDLCLNETSETGIDYVGLSVHKHDVPTSCALEACFSGETVVVERTRGMIKMRDLLLGDEILVNHENRFDKVYSFGHFHETMAGEYIQFHPSKLEVTKDHMLWVKGKGMIPASMVRLDDVLSDGQVVLEIRTVEQKGMYAPFTASGTLVVNGILASNYITFQDSPFLHIGTWSTGLSFHWIAHAVQAPHRLACSVFMDCRQETYAQNGVSNWASRPYNFFRPLLTGTWFG